MKTSPSSSEPSLALVHQLLREGQQVRAIDVLKLLSARYPEFGLYSAKLKQFEKAAAGAVDAASVGTSGLSVSPPAPRQEMVAVSATQHSSGKTNKSSDSARCKITLDQGLSLAARGQTVEARKLLSQVLKEDEANINVLIALAHVDMVDRRFGDALHKAKAALKADPAAREAYRIAEQAAIELGQYAEANKFFLSQPPVKNPAKPRERAANPVLPKEFVLPPIIGAGNDYRHLLDASALFAASGATYTKRVSVIVPVYNRSRILANTLAALTHQTYPRDLIEVIVVDDGSADDVPTVIRKYESRLNLYYSRQTDKGYRLAAARNIGLRQATGDVLVFMDADILPLPGDLDAYMKIMHVSDMCVLIGHRRYVDVSRINDDDILADIKAASSLPNINPNNDVADRRNAEGISVDWRYEVYEKTDQLIKDLWPFTKAAGGNIAFSRKLLQRAGLVDEAFEHWGCEDGEHGYRLYNAGAYFVPMLDVVSLHQEPLDEAAPAKNEGDSFRKQGHEITRRIFASKCPAPTVRNYSTHSGFDVPKVSIYIPAYNAAKYVVEAIQSCLDQDFNDLEVCICDDGSTDGTSELIRSSFPDNPRVRLVRQENGGIGRATNAAIAMCRGMYIGQLDSDDRLKPGAVRACVHVLDTRDVDAVYGDCDYIDGEGRYIRDGWCGGDFVREWLATGMIATHFRMFRKRLWSRIEGCNERIKNAVDYDLWLKLFERGNVHHVHAVLYSYRWHGNNTSIRDRKEQERNHLRVVTNSLSRQRLAKYWEVESTGNQLNPREFRVVARKSEQGIQPKDLVVLIPSCERYIAKAAGARETWVKKLVEAGARVFFVVGKPGLDRAHIEGDTLSVPCRDDYESLLLKLTLAYEFVYRTLQFDFVYKIDDDCFVSVDRLISGVLPQLAGKQYAAGAIHPKGAKLNPEWHFGKCSDRRFDKPFRSNSVEFAYAKGGYGYFIRRDVLPVLFSQIERFKNELGDFEYSYEDVRVAEILATRNILPHPIRDYTISRSDSVTDSTVTVVFDITNPAEFKRLERVYSDAKRADSISITAGGGE